MQQELSLQTLIRKLHSRTFGKQNIYKIFDPSPIKKHLTLQITNETRIFAYKKNSATERALAATLAAATHRKFTRKPL